MLRRGPLDTSPTSAAMTSGLIRDHQWRDLSSIDPASLARNFTGTGWSPRAMDVD